MVITGVMNKITNIATSLYHRFGASIDQSVTGCRFRGKGLISSRNFNICLTHHTKTISESHLLSNPVGIDVSFVGN
jgi:hypothetical protein